MKRKSIKASVRYWDGYKEKFKCKEVRFGCDLLWMRLIDGDNKHIPLRCSTFEMSTFC